MARSWSTDSDGPAGFDVREFARTARGSMRDHLDLSSFAEAPLPTEVHDALAVLAVLEAATMPHLRNVLVTHTHKDARVTAFLVTWAFEKYWIADALRAIVDAGTGPSGAPAASAAARAGTAGKAGDRGPSGTASGGRGPVRRALAGLTQGWDVVGAHLALGLVDDLVLRAAYTRVLACSSDAAVHASIERILAVKERHSRFFDEEVRRRLSASGRAARLARRELRRTTWPLGSGAITVAERSAFTQFTFGVAHGRALEDLRGDLAALPGIDVRTVASVLRGLAG